MALTDKLKAIADAIREQTGSTGLLTLDEMAETIQYLSVSDMIENTMILVDEEGNEYPATLVDEEVTLTATANDIRLGTTAVTDAGVIEGEKEIPSYFVNEGYRLITSGSQFTIPITHYDYQKLQVLICKFNSDLSSSVYTEKVAIDGSVYNVLSTDLVSTVVKDEVGPKINLGIMNESGSTYLVRYFMYREVY